MLQTEWPEKTQIGQDISFMIKLLPDHYRVQESKNKIGSLHCFSKKGIRIGVDAEDVEKWNYIVARMEKHFGPRLQEIDHNICFVHQDFTVYLKP